MMTLKEPSLEIDVTLGTFISVEMVFLCILFAKC